MHTQLQAQAVEAAAVTMERMPAPLCFNSGGRQVANADPGIGGAACALDALCGANAGWPP